MSKLLATLVLIFGSATAFADGFVCESYAGNLRIRVFNQEPGHSGLMIVSNPTLPEHQTLAKFTSDSGLLVQQDTSYTANVDLRFKGSSNGAALVGTMQLGDIGQIDLKVDYPTLAMLTDGAELPGHITLVSRGKLPPVLIEALCEVYIKGEVTKN